MTAVHYVSRLLPLSAGPAATAQRFTALSKVARGRKERLKGQEIESITRPCTRPRGKKKGGAVWRRDEAAAVRAARGGRKEVFT
ncbi:hypothetical protein KC356_g121 [Hortaea werneckii]|nr:hypothetical protein KC356_g121 [Hortaea werneckii]